MEEAMSGNERRDEAGAAARHALVGPPDLWEMKRRFQIDFLRGAGLMPHHRLLDLGCGTLRGGIPLIEYLAPGHYAGVEVRREVLDEGRQELAESGLAGKEPQLVHCSRLAELDLGRTFDVAWAFAVLIHMDDRILDDAVAAVARHLTADGVFYATANVGAEPAGTWQGFPVVHRKAAFYANVFGRHGLVLEDLGSLESFGHVHPRLPVEAQARQRMLKATKAGAV
jgi:SAM-dependent methyltransferase